MIVDICFFFILLSLPATTYKDASQQNKQDRNGNTCSHNSVVHLHGICCYTNSFRFFTVGYTMTAHQKTVGIDSIRSTGDQCTEIFALFDLQVIHFVRKNDADLIYFIGQRLIQGTDHEYVPLFQLVQIGKELGTGKSSVSGKNTVSIDTAYWKGAPFDVTNGNLKDTFICAVIDGKRTLNLRNFDIAHDPGSGNIQQVIVFLLLFLLSPRPCPVSKSFSLYSWAAFHISS